MQNKTLQKAIRLLCSPASLGAMLLLLLNDHVLRLYSPSWFTGKLGDFAWLFFFPFALAALMSFLIPARVPHQEKIVKWLAFGLTGGIFALAKTVPIFHTLTIQLVGTILGFPVGWVRDPSDLIAMVSLAAGWWFWEQKTITTNSRPIVGWAALSFATLLTIANAPGYDYGITELCAEDHTLIARSSWVTIYSSEDGGLSWDGFKGVSDELELFRLQESFRLQHDNCFKQKQTSNPFSDPTNPNILYRYTAGVAIERSDDAGQTWHSEFNLLPVSQAEQASYEKRKGYPTYRAGPLDALADPVSGNVIFAMGHEGLLIRKPTAEWVWVSAGYYQRMGFESALSLLVGEMMLAVGFGLLSIVTLMQQLRENGFKRVFLTLDWVLWGLLNILLCLVLRGKRFKSVILTWGWVLWALNVLVKPALFGNPFGDILARGDLVLVGVGCLILVFLGIGDVIEIAQHNRNVLIRIVIVGLSGMLLFLLPYVLWVLNIILEYDYAMFSAFALVTVTLIMGVFVTHGITLPTRTTASSVK